MNSYQAGDPPALVLGQRGPEYSIPLGIGAKGLNGPMGLAVDAATGNLYVADVGNNRVVRFPAPFDNPGRIEPDAVYGQPNFTTRTAGSPVSNTSMNQPRGVAFDSAGNLWVADTGNHRVLRFSAGSLNNPTLPVAADTVLGQKDFNSGTANAAGNVSASGFDTPVGLAFDSQNNLYVADFRNARVLRFPTPAAGANTAANLVWGQSSLTARVIAQQASASSMAGPEGITVDNNGSLYVADLGGNRVLVFASGGTSGAAARSVIGQPDFTTTAANSGATPFSSATRSPARPTSRSTPPGTCSSRMGETIACWCFGNGSKSANRVWGQVDFSSNGANQVKPGSIRSSIRHSDRLLERAVCGLRVGHGEQSCSRCGEMRLASGAGSGGSGDRAAEYAHAAGKRGYGNSDPIADFAFRTERSCRGPERRHTLCSRFRKQSHSAVSAGQ